MKKGRVVKAYSGWYDVQLVNGGGGQTIVCQPRGRLRQAEDGVLTGDLVDLVLADDGTGTIESVHPRQTHLQRPPVANVQQLVAVFTLRQPPFNQPVLDRLTCLAEYAGLDVVLVLNKVDLLTEDEVAQQRSVYEPTGYSWLAVNALVADQLTALQQLLAGRISVLAGPSGVGKSTLLNSLQPDLELQTQQVSQRLQRGRHTTRHVELLALRGQPDGEPSGYVVDTPGFSQLSITHIPKYELAACFAEMKPLLPACRFDDCLHRAEPGCAVKEAVDQGQIAQQRYRQYLTMLAEVEEAERLQYR